MNKDMRIDMPAWVLYIIETLIACEFEAYAVGGCIRDSLLGRKPHDWDVTTSARPNDVIEIFKNLGYRVVETGLQHGTVTVVIDKESFEITTYRIDGEYEDNRHPKEVEFTSSLKEDLARRDFTINAMAYNHHEGLVDYFGGVEDLNNKIIKCVGKAEDRFSEDALRMMRAIRFSSQLGFDIDIDIVEAICNLSESISNISKERIREELNKILVSDNAVDGICHLVQSGLNSFIIPELNKCLKFNQYNKHHDKDIFWHTLSVVENVPPTPELRLAALLHDIGKPKTFRMGEDSQGHFLEHHKVGADMTREILTRLKYDNKTIDKVCLMVYEHMISTNMKKPGIKKLINRVEKDNIDDLIELAIADRKASAKEYQAYDDILELKNKIDEIINNQEPVNFKDLKINGSDLINLGFKQGKQIGMVLNELLESVLDNPELNNRETLMSLAKDRLGDT